MFKKALLLATFAIGANSFAAEVTGVWSVKIEMDYSQIPADKRAQVQQQIAKVKTIVTFKKDKSFSSTVTGGADGKPHVSSGTWSQKGDMVTITTKTIDGKSATSGTPQVVKLSKDGKSMTMSVQGQAKSGGKGPTVKIIFNKQR